MTKEILSIIYTILYALLNVSGAAIIKSKLKNQPLLCYSDWINFLLSSQTIFAFVLIFFSALLMFKALSYSAFSFIMPIATGINFIATLVAGYLLFREKITTISLIGIIMIFSGIIILSLNNTSNAN